MEIRLKDKIKIPRGILGIKIGSTAFITVSKNNRMFMKKNTNNKKRK
jgi:hypothetical protein